MVTLDFVFVLLALVCFVVEAFRVTAVRNVNLVPLGLAFWVLTLVI